MENYNISLFINLKRYNKPLKLRKIPHKNNHHHNVGLEKSKQENARV